MQINNIILYNSSHSVVRGINLIIFVYGISVWRKLERKRLLKSRQCVNLNYDPIHSKYKQTEIKSKCRVNKNKQIPVVRILDVSSNSRSN